MKLFSIELDNINGNLQPRVELDYRFRFRFRKARYN